MKRKHHILRRVSLSVFGFSLASFVANSPLEQAIPFGIAFVSMMLYLWLVLTEY